MSELENTKFIYRALPSIVGQTRVLVTHGITWLPYVDKIFVMDHGRITETGTYSELMNSGKAFADFINKYKNSGAQSDDEEDVYDEGNLIDNWSFLIDTSV